MREPYGVILAGGRGTRMGGAAKADVMLAGRPLRDHVGARLDPQVAALAINANDPVATDLPVLTDSLTGHLGPLAGVLAGLEWAAQDGASHIVTAAVDTPFFPCDLVPRLQLAALDHPQGFAVAATSDGVHGTFAIWPVDLRAALAQFLTDGGRKVRAFTDAQNAAPCLFADTSPPAFFNINTPDDLAQADRWLVT